MRQPLPLLGDSYKNLSYELSAQTLKNWYIEFNRETNKPISAQPFPGKTLRVSGSGNDGGMFTWRGVTYKVSGTTLYSINSAWVATSIGTINGSGLCDFISRYDEMGIVRNGYAYTYNGTTLTQITDSDLDTPSYAASINQQAIYKGIGNRFGVSDPGDFASIDGLNYAEAESSSGVLIRPYVFNELILLFKSDNTEVWYNSGQGNPPVDRVQNGIIEIGLKEAHTVSNNETFVYWLGNDCAVYRSTGAGAEKVSTIPLATQFRGYDTTGAVGTCFQLRNQEFYRLRFPAEDKTWIFNETGSWSELTTGTSETGDKFTSYTENYGKQLVSVGGNIYSLEDNVYTDAGATLIRERISDKVSAELFGQGYAGLEVVYNRIEIVAKVRALLTGQGSTPTIMLAFSDDHAQTWTELFIEGARQGELWRFQIDELGSAYERVFRVRVSDPIFCSIESAAMDVELSLG